MHNADTLVIELEYTDVRGERSLRKVSPIRSVGRGGMLVMCLATGEPRQMKLDRISRVVLVDAAKVLIPEPKKQLSNCPKIPNEETTTS
jgi:predicted DNA-binding transcriptional regulator YafY